jgi:hypothetical protein
MAVCMACMSVAVYSAYTAHTQPAIDIIDTRVRHALFLIAHVSASLAGAQPPPRFANHQTVLHRESATVTREEAAPRRTRERETETGAALGADGWFALAGDGGGRSHDAHKASCSEVGSPDGMGLVAATTTLKATGSLVVAPASSSRNFEARPP